MTKEELNEAIEYNLRHLEHDYSIEEELEETMKCLKETQQEIQRKDNIINGIKKEINEQLEEYEKGKEEYKKYGNLEDYAKGLRSAYISILDKIKELESK